PIVKIKFPSALLFVSTFFASCFSSRITVASATGLPAVSRIVPSIVTLSDCRAARLCSHAAALEKLIKMAAAIARPAPARFCVLPTERQARCHQLQGETNSLSLRAESVLFFILVAILAPAPVARNQTALDN